MENLLWLTLGNQLVIRGDAMYRVEVGSGMGQIQSGSLADLAFYQLVERHLPIHEVALFAGFRVLLVVTSGVEEAKTFFSRAQSLAAGCWTLELERISKYGTPMLDLFIFKGSRFISGGFLDRAPFIKQTARHIPLSGLSNHPPSCLKTWPLSEMRRLSMLRLYRKSFEHYRTVKLRRFARFFMEPSVLHACRCWRKPVTQSVQDNSEELRVIRAIVPWHPKLYGLNASLQKAFSSWCLSIPIGGKRGLELQFQIGYTLMGRPMFSFCRRP